MHGKGERKTSKSLLLVSCMDNTMVKLVELGSGSAQAKTRRGSREETTRREREKSEGNAHGLLTSSCDDNQARLMRTAIYGIREASEARADKRVAS
jgi:hypothetical protein